MKLYLHPEELHLFRNRVIIIGIVIALIFSLLASRLWYLQILNGEKYAELSRGNRIRVVAQEAPRGVIYDRNGVALADNRPAYQLQLIREDTPDLKKTLTNLSKALNIPYASLLKKLEDNRNQAPFAPIILNPDLENKKAAIVETYQEDFPGVSIIVKSRRIYPFNKIASHILGYVGIRSEKQEKELPKNKRKSGHIVGKTSMEMIHNQSLIGTDGGKQIEIDHVGRELRVLNKPVDPIPGIDLYLTIDINLQRFIYSTMKNQSGVVVVMRPKTGEILGMGSYPNFNPNLFAAGITKRNWNRLLQNPDHPLQNKAIQGTYPPGSPFKMVTGYAGLDLEVIDKNTTFTCNGFFIIKNTPTVKKCWRWKKGGHGNINLKKAIKHSCNVYFYNVAMEIGIDNLHNYAEKFGFGQLTGINLLNEKAGINPNKAWKLKTIKEIWFPGETAIASIGQGYMTVTPFQVINFINIIANEGLKPQPHLTIQDERLPLQRLGLSQKYLAIVKEGMVAAVNEDFGTARKIKSEKYIFAGKTGTAEVVTAKYQDEGEIEKRKKKFETHAWFTAFGPVEDPAVSVVVLVAHGGSGGSIAGPIAKKILDFYMENIYSPVKHTYNPRKFSERDETSFTSRLQAAFL